MKKQSLLTIACCGLFLFLSGCGSEPEWVSIYEECKDKVGESVAEMNQNKDTQAMSGMLESMGNSACEMIKNTCENDPDGAMCQSIVDGYKKGENDS